MSVVSYAPPQLWAEPDETLQGDTGSPSDRHGRGSHLKSQMASGQGSQESNIFLSMCNQLGGREGVKGEGGRGEEGVKGEGVEGGGGEGGGREKVT